jgi:hypothetical protein
VSFFCSWICVKFWKIGGITKFYHKNLSDVVSKWERKKKKKKVNRCVGQVGEKVK